MHVRRFDVNPIIRPNMDDRMAENINGPSIIRVPKWVSNPLGKYYLYFAHHQGTYIRMAYADQLEGPWLTHRPGVLDITNSFFDEHIASPDVHVLEESQQIRMYYHGCCLPEPPHQFTRVAISIDGLDFKADSAILGESYWRAFKWEEYWYTLEMPGRFRRSLTGITAFEIGPVLFTSNMRHCAVQLKGEILTVYYSNAYDCPEQILRTTIDLGHDWSKWKISKPEMLLSVETEYEGVDCVIEPSERGSVHKPVHQLRDPCILEEEGKTYLLYSVAGENGIAIAELVQRPLNTPNRC